MRLKELLRIVWINIIQNKFKVVLTSIGIVVGAATIVMVIAIGRGGQMDVAEQFKNLNAGAIDISYELSADARESRQSGSGQTVGGGMEMAVPDMGAGFPGASAAGNAAGGSSGVFGGGGMPDMGNFEGGFPGGDGGGRPDFGDFGNFGSDFIMGGGFDMSDRMNQEQITLSEADVEDIEVFVPGISAVSISYSSRTSVEGGELEEAVTYTVAGVKENYAEMSNLTLEMGEFITDSNDENTEKVCVLGAQAAKEIFGSALDAYDSILYIDERPYVVNGILSEMGSVSSGISPDQAIFIPYSTGIKYIAGDNPNPTVTVIAEDVSDVETVIANIETVLADSYPNAEFTVNDAGSKMEAASASNDTLTMLLVAMAAIVFIVGGIGIMNVLFVSVKERTNEIGILKALGCTKKDILLEFLFEAAAISVIGGLLGVGFSFGITPVVERLQVRVELSAMGAVMAVCFAVITGTVFGFYPAWKASRLIPVEALNQE